MQDISIKFAVHAEEQLRNHLYSEAIVTCERGLEIYPNYSSAVILLAKAHFFCGEVETAKNVINIAHEKFPLNTAITHIKKQIENNSLLPKELSKKIENVNNDEEAVATSELTLHIKEIQNLANMLKNVDKETYFDEEEDILKNINLDDENINFGNNPTGDNMRLATMQNDMISATDDDNFDSYEIERIDEDTYFSEGILKDSVTDILDEVKINENDINDLEPAPKFEDIFDQYTEDIAANKHQDGAKLYQIDLNFPQITCNFEINLDFPKHIFCDINLNNVNFSSVPLEETAELLIENNNTEYDCIDVKTQEFLELSKQLEHAKISLQEEILEDEEEDSVPLVASETMAKILTKQNNYKKAIKVYQLLINEKPEKANFYEEQIAMLNSNIL